MILSWPESVLQVMPVLMRMVCLRQPFTAGIGAPVMRSIGNAGTFSCRTSVTGRYSHRLWRLSVSPPLMPGMGLHEWFMVCTGAALFVRMLIGCALAGQPVTAGFAMK